MGESVPSPTAGRRVSRRARGSAIARHDGVDVLERNDRIGADGWWRTWNTAVAAAPRRRAGAAVAAGRHRRRELVGRADLAAGRRFPTCWPARPSRRSAVAQRRGRAHLSRLSTLDARTGRGAAPAAAPDTPPLCLPLAPGDRGRAVPRQRDDLRRAPLPPASRWPLPMRGRRRRGALALDAIAEVFAAHGVDPSAPYRKLSIRPETANGPAIGVGGRRAVRGEYGRSRQARRRPRAGCGCGSGRPGCRGPSSSRR